MKERPHVAVAARRYFALEEAVARLFFRIFGVGTAQRFAIYVVLSILYCAPFLLRFHDCVFGIHDWGYPCFREQGSNFFASIAAPLSDAGLGGPNPRATNNPFLFLAFCVAPLSPDIALRLFFLSTLALSGIAADLFASRVFQVQSDIGRLVTGLMYMASPFFATKLVSGHFYFFLGAALVPLALVAYTAIPAGGRRAWAACAMCVAGSLAQLQVGIALLCMLAIVSFRRFAFWPIVGVAAVALLTLLPTIYNGVSAYALGALSNETQLLGWVGQNSVPLEHVLDSTWYFTHYYEAHAGSAATLLWQIVSPLCVLAAALYGGTPRRLAIGVILLGVIASGTRGPLSGALSWAFVNVPATAVFRELYDLLALTPLVVAGGAGLVLEWLLTQHGPSRIKTLAVTASAIVCAGCIWPAVAADAARALPFVSTAMWAPSVRVISARAGADRVLWLPDEIPIGLPDAIGGADPFSTAIGAHPAANDYHPAGILAYASAYADRNGTLPPNLARKLGIGFVIGRPGLVSKKLENAAFGFHELIVPPPPSMSEVPDVGALAIAEGNPICLPALRSQMSDNAPYIDCQPKGWLELPVESARNFDDPRHEWVSGERWAALDFRLVEPRWPVLFTLSANPYTWGTGAPGFVWLYARGTANVDGKSVHAEGWVQLAIATGTHVLRGDGASITAISASTASREPPVVARAPTRLEQLPIIQLDRMLGRYDATLPPHANSVLVLRERWSPFWSARVNGIDLGGPWRADDYATAWRLPADLHQSVVSIRYSAIPPYIVLVAASWLVWIGLCIGALVPWPRQRRAP